MLNIVLKPRGKCSPYSSARKLVFATDGSLYTKVQPMKMQSCGAQSQIYKTTLAPEAQGTLQKRVLKGCKSQGTREFAMSPSNVSSNIYKVSPPQPNMN